MNLLSSIFSLSCSIAIFYYSHNQIFRTSSINNLHVKLTFVFLKKHQKPNITKYNIERTFHFFQNQMKDKGQVSFKFTHKKKHYKPIIIGMVSNYHIGKIKYFFNTLACTEYNGTLMLLTNSLAKKEIDYIKSFSVFFNIILFAVNRSMPYFMYTSEYELCRQNKCEKKIYKFENVCDFCKLNWVSGDERFDIYYCLNENHFFDEYDFLFMTDIADVMFQSDLTQFDYAEGVYLSEEARIYLRKNEYWLRMFPFRLNYTDDMSELCIGTLILVGKESFSFMRDLHNFGKKHENHTLGNSNFQGVLMFMYYNKTNKYPDNFIHFNTNEHGIINSIGSYNKHIPTYNQYYKDRYVKDLYDIQLHDDKYILYNLDFLKYSVIHHTKYFKETFDKTYPGIISICESDKKEAYDHVKPYLNTE